VALKRDALWARHNAAWTGVSRGLQYYNG